MTSPRPLNSSALVSAASASPVEPPTVSPRGPPPPVPGSLQRENSLSRDEKRNLVAREIFSSEETYVGQLDKLVKNFLKPLEKVAPAKTPAIFANVEVLLQFNNEFLQQIKSVVTAWTAAQVIGGVFVKYAAFLKLYTTYASNYQNALKSITEVRADATISALFEEGKRQAGIDLEYLLITPVQRIPRYEMLLRELLKSTPEDHADYASLTEAVKNMKQIAEHVNGFVRNHQNSERAVALGLSSLLIPSRRLMRDGIQNCESAFKPKRAPVQFYLFNDLIIINATPKKKIDPTKVKYHWPITLVWVRDLPGDGPEPAFELVGPNNSYMVFTATQQEKSGWMSDLRIAVAEVCQFDVTGHSDPENYRRGKFVFRDKSSYDGDWYQGKRHGSGTHNLFGAIYNGNWKNDKRHGNGRMSYLNGAFYEGTWESDLPHGFGVQKDEHGTSFSGTFIAGRKNGKGTIRYPNGLTVEGEWFDDSISGIATLTSPSKLRYVGQWANSQFEGKGSLTTASGKTYTGDWKAGQKHGFGVMTWPDGRTYDGEWKQNKRSGQGKLDKRTVDGSLYTGTFVANDYDGHGVMVYGDNSKYEGSWKAGERHGQGTFFWQHGIGFQKYSGEWVKGKMHGKGVMAFLDGSRFEGSFYLDSMHGSGILTFPSGTVFEGKWELGRLDGTLKLRLSSGNDKIDKYNVTIAGNSLEFTELKGARSGGGPPSTLIPSPIPYISLPTSWTSTPLASPPK